MRAFEPFHEEAAGVVHRDGDEGQTQQVAAREFGPGLLARSAPVDDLHVLLFGDHEAGLAMTVEEEAHGAARFVEGRGQCAAGVDVQPERGVGAAVVGAVEAELADEHPIARFALMGEGHGEEPMIPGQRAAEGLALAFGLVLALDQLPDAGAIRRDREQPAGLVVGPGGDAPIGRGEDQLVVVDPVEVADVVVGELHHAAGLDLGAQFEHVETHPQSGAARRGNGQALAVRRELGLIELGVLEEHLRRHGGRHGRRLRMGDAMQAGQREGERQRAAARDGDRCHRELPVAPRRAGDRRWSFLGGGC
ncbi:hypothetical protein ACFJIX_28575 [Roseateles sp. UC29_93]|uniref:hypothetical protein n=1 Tax=Roseateles sp. UC29_93 TaxID=3350177 RepID=UPI00366D4821